MDEIRPNTLRGAARPNSLGGMGPPSSPGVRGAMARMPQRPMSGPGGSPGPVRAAARRTRAAAAGRGAAGPAQGGMASANSMSSAGSGRRYGGWPPPGSAAAAARPGATIRRAGGLAPRPGAAASQFQTPTSPPRGALAVAVDVLSYLIAGPAAVAVVAGLVMTLADEGATSLTPYGQALTAAGVWALVVWVCLRGLRTLAVARTRGAIGPLGLLAGSMVAIFIGIGALDNFAAQLPLLVQGP